MDENDCIQLCSLIITLGQFNIRTVAIFRLKFRRFLVIFSKITQFSEMLYTLLESPNMQLHIELIKKGVAHRESVAGSVIQATGTVEFEDGLRTGVLPGGCWCPCGGRT